MAIETDVSELRDRQKKKSKRNFLIRFFAVLIVCAIIVVAVFTKDKWYPYLDGILNKAPSGTALDSSGNAELSEGLFPISIESGSDYQMKAMGNYFAVLDDSRFFVYTTDGESIFTKQHSFANPILTVSDKKALIYDLGGNNLSLESKYKTIYEKTFDNTILKASLSSNDMAAVVTKSDKFLAELNIFDSTGKNIFTYKSYDSRITDVNFLPDNSGCVVTTLGASGGEVISGLIKFNFTSTEMVWKSDSTETLAVNTNIDNSGNIVIIGDSEYVYYSSDGTKLYEQSYNDDIVDYCYSDNLSAVLLENTMLRKYSLVITNSSNPENSYTIELPEETSKLFADGDFIYILTNSGIYTYNSMGQQISETKLTDSYDNFCKIGGYFFLLGYDEINRISFG